MKNIWRRWERLRGLESHSGSRLSPPAPLTGDVGRGCCDASRALLLSSDTTLAVGKKSARHEARRTHFTSMQLVARSGSRRPWRAVAGIALEEQRLAGDRRH